MRYQVSTDKKTYTGSALEIVSALRGDRWYTTHGKTDYMEQVAIEVRDKSGARVRTASPAQFLEDLAAAGLIRLKSIG